MKHKTPLILLIMVALLTMFIWFYERRPEPGPNDHDSKLIALQRSDLTEIRLTRANADTLLKKTGDDWELAQPVKARASRVEMERLLNELEFARISETITAAQQKMLGQSHSDYGLVPPRVTVEVRGKSGAAETLLIGNDTPVGDFVYVKRAQSSDVALVAKSLAIVLDKPANQFRDRTLLDFVPFHVSKLEVRTMGHLVDIQKKDNRWTIARPIAARADTRKVSGLLTELGKPSIQDFVAEGVTDFKPFGLDEPATEITLGRGADQPDLTLQLGAALSSGDTKKVYAKRKGEETVFTVAADLASAIAPSLNDLRSRQLVDFQPAEIGRLEITTAQETIDIVLDGERWIMKSPRETQADGPNIRVLLNNLRNAQVKEFVEDMVTDLSKFGLANPASVITIYRKPETKDGPQPKAGEQAPGEKPSDTPAGETTAAPPAKNGAAELTAKILLGRVDSEKGLLFVKRADEPFVYGIDASIAERIKTSSLAYQNHTLLAVNADDIIKLSISCEGRNISFEKSADGRWQLPQGQGGIIDHERLSEVLHLLAVLRAEQLVANSADNLAQYGLQRPFMTVRFEVRSKANGVENPPNVSHDLFVGAESPLKRRFALFSGKPPVFELDNSTFNLLFALSAMAPKPSPPNP